MKTKYSGHIKRHNIAQKIILNKKLKGKTGNRTMIQTDKQYPGQTGTESILARCT